MWVVAAAHKKSTGPIDSYDSLNDAHLRAHYHKCLVKQRLASVGLVQCLGHRDKPDARRCTCASSAASRDNASTTSSGDSGVCLQKDAATSCCAACGRTALPAALREPVSPYLLPVNPSRKQLMPRLNLQAVPNTAGPRGLRRTGIMPASSSDGRQGVAPKNHFPKKSDCKVSLVFHGSGRRALSEARLPVRVTQQHCGGTSLTVYDSQVARGGTFTFASRRHCGYPFSIVIFVDDIRDVQLSSCCEYRYKVGVRLGGPQGHFSLLRLQGGGPCYRCVLEERLKALPPLVRREQRSADSHSSGLSSPVTSSEATNQQSLGDDRSPASSTAERDNIEHSTTASLESRESDGETAPQIMDAAANGRSSNATSYSTEASSSPSQPGTSASEAVQEQIEGGSESSHLSAETVASEIENAPASNSFEASSNGGEKLSEKSVLSETGSDTSDKNQHKAHRSAVHSSAYFVQDKRKQWGSDECRGESFSSDDDAQTVTVTVHADVHSTP